MGPRPDGRGRIRAAAVETRGMRLQWGRGRMAAEGTSCRRAHPLHIGFNGAAAGWPRKVRGGGRAHPLPFLLQWGRGRMAAEGLWRYFRHHRRSCFNGAAAGWPRKGPSRPWRRRGSWGFNGAAAGWPRKGPSPAGAKILSPLQWGRGRMAAEGGRPGHALHAGRASMGPRPDGRGRAPRGGRAWLKRYGFNGAAAGWPRKAACR